MTAEFIPFVKMVDEGERPLAGNPKPPAARIIFPKDYIFCWCIKTK